MKELDSCKESSSDFHVDSPDFENTFTAWPAPAFGQNWIDHTWVKSKYPEDRFCCAGGTDEVCFIREAGVKKSAYKIMDACRGGGWPVLKDCAGVLYLLEGVCHQMSNRFMFPVSGKYMLYNAGHPKGYSISVAAYGFTGLGFEEWYEGTYLSAAARFGEEAGIPENAPCMTYDMERELAMLQEDVASVFGCWTAN